MMTVSMFQYSLTFVLLRIYCSVMASTDSGQKGFFLQIVNQAEATILQLDFSVCSCSFRELVVDSVLDF